MRLAIGRGLAIKESTLFKLVNKFEFEVTKVVAFLLLTFIGSFRFDEKEFVKLLIIAF